MQDFIYPQTLPLSSGSWRDLMIWVPPPHSWFSADTVRSGLSGSWVPSSEELRLSGLTKPWESSDTEPFISISLQFAACLFLSQ